MKYKQRAVPPIPETHAIVVHQFIGVRPKNVIETLDTGGVNYRLERLNAFLQLPPPDGD
jgi:hypothetical protein